MGISIHLLGRPSVHRAQGEEGCRLRSQKSWAVLAYLLLSQRPVGRERLAELLFSSAEDPLRALRWSLSEVRRALGEGAVISGDPVTLTLSSDTSVDVLLVAEGSWQEAARLPALGAALLEGMAFRDAGAFETWLLAERRRVAAASEAMLNEAALGSLSRGNVDDAISFASRLVSMEPLDESHQALLIRTYRRAGDDRAAERQLAACTELFARELGVAPGPVVRAAARGGRRRDRPADESSVTAMVEAGQAAVAAGAVVAGVDTMRAATGLADRGCSSGLRVGARLALAETLIHALRDEDEEGVALLHDAVALAERHGHAAEAAHARTELGYVEFLRARYDRAGQWFRSAIETDPSDSVVSKAAAYLGAGASDTGEYAVALAHLDDAVEAARRDVDPRREAYAEAMVGRVHLLREDLHLAAEHLSRAVKLADAEHWLVFLPWPQAMLGELEIIRGNTPAAADVLPQAFARACQLADPCWEGASGRGLALLAESRGETDRAFAALADARQRCRRAADTYVWLDAFILEAQAALGVRHEHPNAAGWVSELHEIASRGGMRDLMVRSLLHLSALGDDAAEGGARALAEQVDNPVLRRRAGVR